MEGSGSGHRPYGVVSGKGYSSNCSYTGRPGSACGVPAPGSGNRGSQSAPKPWGFKDPEAKRRKRISKYKVYTVEGKVKTSLRKGLRWIKNKCSQIVNGY
ncbi:hypothetical protein QN277_021693 [Acacia crassicarpa]|uniref:DUF3511 domain-containing protein n=1 Tax=Acacia crassicarpa TaxID=499986 RepID=A0AAE1JSC4_9FABA|nr:hypothetical protein QN277_021693 [Acacia crassicarpa]